MRPILPLLPCLALLLTPLADAEAEVVLDGTVGSRGKLTLNGRDVRITPDMGSTRGGNLFHSFEKFGVPSGDAVTFEGPGTIERVIGRVTGQDPSQIHGTLRSTAPNASLWLVNPNGLVVGKDATVDVPGALRLSTADELRFSDGSRYSARDVAGSTLTAADPAAFGFLGGPIGRLSVEAPTLQLGTIDLAQGLFRPGSLALVGGEVDIRGSQIEVNGPILIAAQAGAGEVPLDGEAVMRDGTIRITEGSILGAYLLAGSSIRIEGGSVVLDHARVIPTSLDDPNDPTGVTGLDLAAKSVALRGEGVEGTFIISSALFGDAADVSITAGTVTVEGAGIVSIPLLGERAGDVRIVADRIELGRGALVGSPTGGDTGAGAGGETRLVATDRIELRDGAQINSVNMSDQQGGSIVLQTRDLVIDQGIVSTSTLPNNEVMGTGAAGSISVAASGEIVVSGGSLIATLTTNDGAGGNIRIEGDQIALSGDTRLSAQTFTSGDAGSIRLVGRSIDISDGTDVDVQTVGSGKAGQIEIEASQNLRIAGSSLSSGNAFQGQIGTGPAGAIRIVSDGTVTIAADSLVSSITANATKGGNVTIQAGQLTIEGGGQVSTAAVGEGAAGAILIRAGSVLLDDGIVDAQSLGTGAAGGIAIEVARDLTIEGGVISTSSIGASGGSIDIRAGDRVVLSEEGGILTAILGTGADERAGAITIAGPNGTVTPNVVLDATSGIAASAPNVGDGGTIRITTDGLIARPGQIDASARQGNAGTVATTSPQTNIVSSFAGLDAQVAPADRLLATSCDAREIASSLVVGAVRGGEDAFDPRRPLGGQAQADGCAR